MIIKTYRFIQALSLDIALGAVILSTAVARYYNVLLTWPIQVCLFIAVWLIYTFDHLMDSDRALDDRLSFRHYIHRRYRKKIVYVSIAAILLGVSCIFLLPSKVILWGVITAAFIVIYFLLVRFTMFWIKEVFVAIGYTAGVFLAPLTLLSQWPDQGRMWLTPCVFLVALINLLLFSFYDHISDENNGFHSLATRLGAKITRVVISTLLVTTLVIVLWLLTYFHEDIMFWIVLAMTGLLSILHLYPSTFRPSDNYRILGDGIFYLPLLYLIYA